MKTVNFKYDVDQKVFTPFDEKGIITMLGYDEAGQQYYVKTANNNSWFKEDALKVNEPFDCEQLDSEKMRELTEKDTFTS